MLSVRLPMLVVAIALAASILAGCGSSSDESSEPSASPSTAPLSGQVSSCGSGKQGTTEIRVTALGCAAGYKVSALWAKSKQCTIPSGASRGSCRIGPLTCLSTVTDKGVNVSCATRNNSISFIARR